VSFDRASDALNELAELAAEADEATAATRARHLAEQLGKINDLALKRLAEVHKIGIAPHDVIAVRLQTLVETLFGTLDDEAHSAYEIAVQTKLKGIIEQIEAQANRSKLLQGVPGMSNVQITLPGDARRG